MIFGERISTRHSNVTARKLLFIILLATGGCDRNQEEPARSNPGTGSQAPSVTRLGSLSEISIDALRERNYGSQLKLETRLEYPGTDDKASPGTGHDLGSNRAHRFAASYVSDGLRIYSRIDIPVQPLAGSGYPVLVFVHGWIGRDAAPEYNFTPSRDSTHSRLIDKYVEAGFVVFSPALRGHGTLNGVPADGIGFLTAWDNASYISPVFYAVDVLNLIEGIQTLETVDKDAWKLTNDLKIDTSRINIAGHSQGGDAALLALAVSGEGSSVRNTIAAGSLWSGCFGTRFEQAGIYGPMGSTLEAFMSGDGTWTGTALSPDGTVNPEFIFGWPPDWIGTTDTSSPEWTWQAENWPVPTVREALEQKYSEMYSVINQQVDDISDAGFQLVTNGAGNTEVRHDARMVASMSALDAFRTEEYLTEAIHFHHSDRDYYSIPRWNADLSHRINQAGGKAVDFNYPGNNHSLLISTYDWFNDGEVIEGFDYMLERDIELFGSGQIGNPEVLFTDPASLESARRYASTVHNEFKPEFTRTALAGISRQVVSFKVDGLKQFALILTPETPAPAAGWPVLVMNHGHHPDPPRYGRVSDGSTDRPGDYYRGLPLAYAQKGFLVVVPDFRGHNDSESGGYTQSNDEADWYTRDTIAAVRAIPSLPQADSDNVFMWGHSMGGMVTLRALMVLGPEIRGASIWSSSLKSGPSLSKLPLSDIETPLSIHHSIEDKTTMFAGSKNLHEQLTALGKPTRFYPVTGTNHLFDSNEQDEAITRDSSFFMALSQKPEQRDDS